jgi:hypothetical protein
LAILLGIYCCFLPIYARVVFCLAAASTALLARLTCLYAYSLLCLLPITPRLNSFRVVSHCERLKRPLTSLHLALSYARGTVRRAPARLVRTGLSRGYCPHCRSRAQPFTFTRPYQLLRSLAAAYTSFYVISAYLRPY